MTTATRAPAQHRAAAPQWTLLTMRGLALLYIARHPGCTKRELGQALGVGERTTTTLIGELASAGAIRGSDGSGGRLHYEINPNAPLEIEDGRHTDLRALLNRLAA